MYTVGDTVRSAATNKDGSGNPVDPSGGVTLTVMVPDGTQLTPPVTHTGTGAWSAAFVPTVPGRYVLLWVGLGTNAFSDPQTENVYDTSGSLISLGELKEYLGVSTQVKYDEELRQLLNTVTDVVEHYAGSVIPRTYDEPYDGGSATIALRHAPLIEVLNITEFIGPGSFWTLSFQPVQVGTVFDAFGYAIENKQAGVISRRWNGYAGPFRAGVGNIRVQYVAGRAVVPPSIIQAVKDIARINWQPRLTGQRIQSGGVDTQGGEMYMGLWVPSRVIDSLVPSITQFGIG